MLAKATSLICEDISSLVSMDSTMSGNPLEYYLHPHSVETGYLLDFLAPFFIFSSGEHQVLRRHQRRKQLLWVLSRLSSISAAAVFSAKASALKSVAHLRAATEICASALYILL